MKKKLVLSLFAAIILMPMFSFKAATAYSTTLLGHHFTINPFRSLNFWALAGNKPSSKKLFTDYYQGTSTSPSTTIHTYYDVYTDAAGRTGNITKVFSYSTSSYWVAEGSTFPYTPQGSSTVYTYAQIRIYYGGNYYDDWAGLLGGAF